MAGGDKRQQLVKQITTATGVVYNQLGRLGMIDKKFATTEAYYLEQITSNIRAGNNTRAKTFATELGNMRRLRRTTQHTGIAKWPTSIVERDVLGRGELGCERLVQPFSKGANEGQGVTLSCSRIRCNDREEAEELLEPVSAE